VRLTAALRTRPVRAQNIQIWMAGITIGTEPMSRQNGGSARGCEYRG